MRRDAHQSIVLQRHELGFLVRRMLQIAVMIVQQTLLQAQQTAHQIRSQIVHQFARRRIQSAVGCVAASTAAVARRAAGVATRRCGEIQLATENGRENVEVLRRVGRGCVRRIQTEIRRTQGIVRLQ